MKREFQNLLDREKWLVLNLKNVSYQTKLYLAELPKFINVNEDIQFASRGKWFSDVFTYYSDQLIPAIQEQSEMEKRHLVLFENNPDDGFRPEYGVQDHQRMTEKFLVRFAEVHKDFSEFISEVKAYRMNKNQIAE